MSDTGKFFRLDVFVKNYKETSVNVLPEHFTVESVAPKPKVLKQKTPAEIAKSINRRAAWGGFFAAMGGALATEQRTTQTTTNGRVSASDNRGNTASGTYSEQSTTTTTGSDRAAQERARQQQAEIAANANDATAYLDVIALRANTLRQDDFIVGAVFFERDKKAETITVRIPIDGVTYEFTITRGKK